MIQCTCTQGCQNYDIEFYQYSDKLSNLLIKIPVQYVHVHVHLYRIQLNHSLK